ncbi:potassium channel family protein [Pirellulales bacterium]|nr:potassium channel family protein [Pirellulales bacterium]
MSTVTNTVTTDSSVAFKQSQRFVFYHIIISLIGLFSVLLVGAEALIDPKSEMHHLFQSFDFAICILLLMDFVGALIAAPNKWHYFKTWGWLDLISSIPAIPLFRCGRIVRLIRVIRIIRSVKATRLVASTFFAKKGENTLLGMVLVTLILIVTCSATVLHFERLGEGNILTADDALWWSVATVTTVGYGDKYPITVEGRFVAGLLMVAGVGLFGLFSGFIASWILGEDPNAGNEGVASIASRLDRIEQTLAEVKNKL